MPIKTVKLNAKKFREIAHTTQQITCPDCHGDCDVIMPRVNGGAYGKPVSCPTCNGWGHIYHGLNDTFYSK